MNGRSLLRSAAGKVSRPLVATLDRRLDALATRLERHTERLAVDQRTEIHRIDDRLTLDVAVLSEHLVGIDRTARRVSDATRPTMPRRFLLALPGEPLHGPEATDPDEVAAFVRDDDGAWVRAAVLDDSSLRVVVLPARPPA